MSIASRRNRLVRLAPQKRNSGTLLEANERLKMLQQVTEAVHSTLDSEDVFKRITDGAVSSLGYTIAFVVVLNSEKKCCEIKALSAKNQLLPQMKKILGFSLSSLSIPADPELNATTRALGEGRVVVVKTLAEIAYPVISKEVCSAIQEFAGGKNYIAVPLQTKGGVVGGIFVASPREEVPEEELTMLQSFAGAASQAIRNANLYTRTKQTQELLRESEEKYRTIFENVKDVIVRLNRYGEVVDLNKRAEDYLGYKQEEIVGKNFTELGVLSPKDLTRIAKLFDETVKGKLVPSIEVEAKRKDGSTALLEVNTALIEKGGKTEGTVAIIRDITERKQAELEYKTIIQTTIDGFWLVDMQGRFLDVNNAYCQLIGYSRDELLKMSIPDIEAIEKPEETVARIAKIMKVGGDRFETCHRRKDGRIVDVEVSVDYIDIGGGRMFVFIRDISDRKRAEEALRESEKQYRLLAENVTDVILTVSVNSPDRLIYISPSVKRLLGYSVEEAMSKEMRKVFTPTSFESAMRTFAEEMATEEKKDRGPFSLRTLELELERKDGSVVPVEVNYSFIRGPDGRPNEILAVAREITERKQAEEALKDSRRRFRDMVNLLPQSVWEIDTEGRVTFLNRQGILSYGYVLGEVTGPFNGALASVPEDRDRMKENTQRILNGEKLGGIEYTALRKDGSTFPVITYAAPIIQGNKAVGLRGVTIDISERKQAEELYTTFANSSPVGIYIAVDNRFVFSNPTLQKTTGYTADELLATPPAALVHPEDVESTGQKQVQMLKGKTFQPYEYRFITKSGQTGWSLERVASITYQGKLATLGISIDITEHKQAEQLYHTLADSSPASIYIGQDDKFIYVNPAFQEASGYTEKELLGRDLSTIVHPDDRESIRENVVQMLKGKRLEPYEFRFVTKSGETGWVLERVVSITYQGSPAILGVCVNTTERKQAEELHRTLADSSPVGVYIVQDRKCVFTNPAFRRSTGFTEDELLGMDPLAVVRPEDRESVRQSAVQMLKGKRFQPYEFRFITKSGETKWALERVTSITYQGKQATLGNFLDVTESKQAQERIERAAEEWRTTFDSIMDFISIHDKDNRIIRVNKAMAGAFKTTPQLLLAKACHEVMHGTEEPPANCPHREALRTGKPATIEMFEPSLGIFLQESASPIFDEKGEITGTVHVVRDVTQQKRMEEQLVMTDRLASIGELASGIAHELNNPLTSVIGFSQLLMEGNVPDNIKEDLGTVYSEAQRAATIVKNLLTFARKHASVKQLSQVNAIIEDVLRLRAYEQKVNNIEVDKRLATDLPEIMVDYFQMQQAFLNIIVNAESAMLEAHGKGKLAITTERVNGGIKVTFTDDGPGILKENMKRIFAPFFTTKEVGKGTGLGLSICHGIVSGHGGQIYAKSEFGRGATFVVELPLNGN
jgi:PAS domain S-box-containing protein